MTDPREHRSSRRQLLRQMAGVSMALPLDPMDGPYCAGPAAQGRQAAWQTKTPLAAFSPEDEQFLDDLERSNFLFFWEQASPQTGLIKDRCNARITDTGKAAALPPRALADSNLHCRKRRFRFPSGRSPARAGDPHLPVENAADALRILLPLCQYQYR